METGYFTTIHQSPVGKILLTANSKALTGLYFYGNDSNYIIRKKSHHAEKSDLPIFKEAETQLEEYFAGKRKQFALALVFNGTGFQKRVWNELFNIPFGETASYLQIAEQIGKSSGCKSRGINQRQKSNFNHLSLSQSHRKQRKTYRIWRWTR